MARSFSFAWLRGTAGRVRPGVDGVLFGLSIYGLPVLIGVFCLLALVLWQPRHAQPEVAALAFRVSPAPTPDWTPQQALAALAPLEPVTRHDTHLSETPRWLLFRANAAPADQAAQRVELGSRHASWLRCWDADTLQPLGSADRRRADGQVSQVRAGFVVALTPAPAPHALLCEAGFVGPARLTLAQWSQSDLDLAVADFERKSGLLDGGLLVLAAFVLITGLVNRNATYLLFAVWLMLNLRMGQLSVGWDTEWLGGVIPPDWLNRIRLVTVSLYYSTTLTLFLSLFKEDLRHVGYHRIVRFFQWTCVPLIALSAFLPYAIFLPIAWVCTGLGVVALIFLLVLIVRKRRSLVAIWYSAAMSIVLFASFYEVIAAALGLKGLLGSVNSVTAALSSSLLASLAIAAQMRQEHEQKLQAQAELQHAYEVLPIGLFALTLEGRFLGANPALRRMLGIEFPGTPADTWARYFGADNWQQLRALSAQHKDIELEQDTRATPDDQNRQRFLVQATLTGDRIEGSLRDITERSRALARLRFLAEHDPLTDALNRHGMEQALSLALERLRYGVPLALAYLNFDRFKLINDLHGHAVGDEILRQACARVQARLPASAQLGRVGGDEFLLLMPGTAVAAAADICRSIADSIGNPAYRIGERVLQVQGSIGVVEVTPDSSIKDAIAVADRACQLAKITARGNLMVFEKNSLPFLEHEQELQLAAQLSGSDATQGLHLVMQPMLSLGAPADSLNFEVLLRMRNPAGEPVPTSRLLAAAERSGRMGMIDRWVLRSTLAWLATHIGQLPNTRFVCVNLSGSSINDDQFTSDAIGLLAQHPEIAKRLCLEITESVALRDIGRTRQFIHQIRACGAKVALDDFGAGYTSFTYLMDLPSDLLKIDGSLIVNINQHPANVAIVQAIVNLARNLGMKTIAEWAEDAATVQTLAEIGVDYIQGYVISTPQEPDHLLNVRSAIEFIHNASLKQFVELLER